MGVMESMRSSSDSTFMQVVLVLVIISFVGWYAVPQGDKATVVATVNGVRIMDTEFRREFMRAEQQRAMETGRSVSMEEEKALSEQVRQALIETEAVIQRARKMGLEVSEYEIAAAILAIDEPQPGEFELNRARLVTGDDGKLDRERWEAFLKRQGMTEGDYQEVVRRQLLFNKARALVFAGTTLPDPVLQRLFEQRQRLVDVTYARVRSSAFYTSVPIADPELDAWIVENEERIRAAYDRDFETRFKHPEQLHFSMLRKVKGEDPTALVPVMNDLRSQAAAGADFAELARTHSDHASAEQGGDMGTKPVIQLAPEILEVLADLQPDDVSRVITGLDDMRIYKLHARIAPTQQSYDEVKRGIAERMIREERAPALAAAFAEQELLPAWQASGEVPTELLEGKQLTAMTTGLVPVGGGANPFGPPPELMEAAAAAEVNAVLPEVYEAQGVLWVAQVMAKQEADLSEFTANRDRIAAEELYQRRQQVFSAWVMDAVAQSRVE